MTSVLADIKAAIVTSVEATTPGDGGKAAAFRFAPSGVVPKGDAGDRVLWWDAEGLTQLRFTTNACGPVERLLCLMPLRLRLAGFGPDDDEGTARVAADVPRVVQAINQRPFWPVNTVFVSVRGGVTYERTKQDLTAIIPITVEYEEVPRNG